MLQMFAMLAGLTLYPLPPSPDLPVIPVQGFTTAAEVKPILQLTKANWVAVREYDGQDIVYFTQILSWRCGLTGMRYALNDGELQDYALPPCHEDLSTPNALLDDEAMPIMGLEPNSVQRVSVELTFDDGSLESASFERAAVLIP